MSAEQKSRKQEWQEHMRQTQEQEYCQENLLEYCFFCPLSRNKLNEQSEIIRCLEKYSISQLNDFYFREKKKLYKYTLLMWAIKFHLQQVVEFLLVKDVDVGIHTDRDVPETALDIALKEQSLNPEKQLFSEKTILRLTPEFWRVCKVFGESKGPIFIRFPLPKTKFSVKINGDDKLHHSYNLTTDDRDIITTLLSCNNRIETFPTELVVYILSLLPYYPHYY